MQHRDIARKRSQLVWLVRAIAMAIVVSVSLALLTAHHPHDTRTVATSRRTVPSNRCDRNSTPSVDPRPDKSNAEAVVKPTFDWWHMKWPHSSHMYLPLFETTVSCPPPPSPSQTTSHPLQNATLVTLISFNGHGRDLSLVLTNWHDRFLSKWRYPLHIFHFGQLEASTASSFAALLPGIIVTFEEVQLSGCNRGASPHIDEEWEERKKMSLFLAWDMFFTHTLLSHRYYLRLDADVLFLTDVTQDPFAFMEWNDLRCGYTALGMPEHPTENVHLLVERAHSFLLRKGILPPTDISALGEGGLYDTLFNGPFELYRTDVFANPLYREWAVEIDIWEGIYSWDWREQSIKTLWPKVYLSRYQTHWFCDIGILHKIEWIPRCIRICA